MPESKENKPASPEDNPTKLELDLFFNYSLDLLVLVGFDNCFKQVSPSFERILGWTKEEVISKPFYNFLHPDDVEKNLAEVKTHETGENTVLFVNRYRCKDDSYKWISWNSHPLPEKQIIVGIGRDITGRKQVEEVLRLNEERFSKVFRSSPFAVIITRYSDGTYVDVNDTFLKMFEFSREEVIGHTANEIKIYAKPDGRVAYLAAFKNGRVSDFEVDLKTKTGKPLKALGFAEIININGQDLTIGTLIDITERKRAEEDLKESLSREHFLAQLVRDASVAVGVGYPDGRLGLVNDAFEKLTGYSQEELQKISWNNILTPSEYSEYENAKLAEVNQTKKPIRYEKEYIRKDGSRVPIELTVNPFLDEEGNVTSYFSFIMDITDRKKAEKILSKKQDELQTIIDSSQGLIFYKDLENHFIRVNKAFAEIMGLPKEQLEGRSLFEIYPKEEAEAFWSDDKQVIVSGKAKGGIEEKMQSKQGQRWVQTDKIPYRDTEGNVIGVIGFSVDITERKKAEEALNKLNEELEEKVLKRTKEVSAERQRLYNVLEALPAYVILLDKDYCVPFANKVFRERFGESYGRRCYDFLFKRESPCENCETYKVLKTNGPHRWEWTGPDGRDYDIYDFPFVETDGSTLILEMGIDITERKRAEKQIRDVSLYSRSLIEASLDPLVTISAEGKITDVNQATELATGCSREELIGSDFSDYFTEPEKAKIGYKQVFSEGFVRDYPLAIKHKSGKITDVLYNATIYTNEAGEMQGVFAAARDITERKKAEAQAQVAAKKLKDAERLAAIGATAGMVGHDIRNPLQAITGDVYLAKTELDSIPEREEKKSALESLQEIEKNTRLY